MFAVADFVHRYGIQSANSMLSSTDIPCTWDKPCIYTSSSDVEGDIVSALEDIKDSQMWDRLIGDSPNSPLLNLPDLAQLYKLERFQGSFSDFLKVKVTDEIREEIFRETKQQYKSPLWKLQRVGALTASILHQAARYKGSDPDNYVVRCIMGKLKFSGNKATDYGLKYEALARKLYEKYMKSSHQWLKVMSSGLLISKDNPLLRASPDAIVSCKCCGKGLVEIKCPYSEKFKKLTREEIAQEGKYHLKIGDSGKAELNHTSPWYTQIQMQLAVSNSSWCDSVLFTQKGPHISIERIYFDKVRFESKLESALDFHNSFIMPQLM